MAAFMDENFLLSNSTAIHLFHNYAKNLPIIDYHCHIQQHEILEDKQFSNLTQMWLAGDHYKWRAMRSVGIDEKYITGESSDFDKFLAWATTLPQLIGNPLYHWTHLELQRYFGIYDILNPQNAAKIWDESQRQIQSGELTVRKIIAKSNVEVICTTDDPIDDLLIHRQLATELATKVLPSFRPDKALAINNPEYCAYLDKLAAASGIAINSLTSFLQALAARVEFFNTNGCKVSDHGLNYVPFATASVVEVEAIFAKALTSQTVTALEETQFRSYVLIFLGEQYQKYGWAMQYHMNSTRNNNSTMFTKLGADSGFDAINDTPVAEPLSRLLDAINSNSGLPKTILYSLNGSDNYLLATLMGCFQDSTARGKIQLGSGWWFNDQRDGMEEQLKAFANLGALATFVGMLTDSRSFLSYTRHEYFRRILCNLIGRWVENGEYPADEDTLAKLVADISYYNAKNYFNFG